MAKDAGAESRGPIRRWFDETFHDWWFRSMIGPAQTSNAVQGCDEQAREQWKRDLENRKRYTREQKEHKRLAREAGRRG